MKINVGPGPHYVDGWTNVDVARCFKADVYLDDPMVLPFEDESASVIYCAHILEHIVWEDVTTYLLEMRRVLKPGGFLIAVGPDVKRGCEMYKAGTLTWEELWPLMEWPDLPNWDAPRHFWNCSEERLLKVLAPLFVCTPVPIESSELDQYPVTSRIGWQAAIICKKQVEEEA